jgi:hypothetical protein
MGYAYYVLADGREAGYAVEDVCNQDGCEAKIDRGLAFLCGKTPGGDEYGCGGYFCGEDLTFDQCPSCWETNPLCLECGEPMRGREVEDPAGDRTGYCEGCWEVMEVSYREELLEAMETQRTERAGAS